MTSGGDFWEGKSEMLWNRVHACSAEESSCFWLTWFLVFLPCSLRWFSGITSLLPCNCPRSFNGWRPRLCHSARSACAAFRSFFPSGCSCRLPALLGIPLLTLKSQQNLFSWWEKPKAGVLHPARCAGCAWGSPASVCSATNFTLLTRR